jgi:hybrid cluster-associated redox disulfide protein
MKIRKDMTITEILQIDPMIANILMGQGMHCITCEAAYGETLEEACAVHGFDEEGVNALVEQLNDFIATA